MCRHDEDDDDDDVAHLNTSDVSLFLSTADCK